MSSFDKIVSLDLAKRLKSEGYSKPCEYYYQDIDLPYSKKGLKRTKHSNLYNHNKYDDFVYSAPTIKNAVDYLLGKKMFYESSIVIKFVKNETT